MNRLTHVQNANQIGQLPARLYSTERHHLNLTEFEHLLRTLGAYWQMPAGNPQAPHVQLSSGEHSNLFLNVATLLTYPNVTDMLASAMVHLVREVFPEKIDWVVGSDHSGAAITFAMARILGARAEFFEKGVVDGRKVQLWKRQQIPQEQTVLFVEELTTTLGTIEQMFEGFALGNRETPTIVPLIPVIVDRTGAKNLLVRGKQVKGLYTYPDARSWKADECGFCPKSPLIQKPRDNWDFLMAHCAP